MSEQKPMSKDISHQESTMSEQDSVSKDTLHQESTMSEQNTGSKDIHLQGSEMSEQSKDSKDSATSSTQGPRQLHRGQKVLVDWAGKEKELVDGFGLCSPTLWEPDNRSAYLDEAAKSFCSSVFDLISGFVKEKFEDPKREAIRLGLGHISSSPFSSEELLLLRKRWAQLLPSPGMALEVPEQQPFFLGMIGQSLELVKDPDFDIFMGAGDAFWTGGSRWL